MGFEKKKKKAWLHQSEIGMVTARIMTLIVILTPAISLPAWGTCHIIATMTTKVWLWRNGFSSYEIGK